MERIFKLLKWVFYPVLIITGSCAMYFQILGYRNNKVKKYKPTYNLFNKPSKVYPKGHWKYQVSKYCMSCGHGDFITRHWGEDGLFCENCKSTHKGKIAKHYMYDKAITCKKCGHKDNIPKGHEDSEISCYSCKMGHYDHYSKNVLNKGKI